MLRAYETDTKLLQFCLNVALKTFMPLYSSATSTELASFRMISSLELQAAAARRKLGALNCESSTSQAI